MSARRALAVLLFLLLAGCAGPTAYRPTDGYEGFSEQRLEADRFRVSFAGNSLTPRDVVQNYLLFRAAELTLANGADHFVVVAQQVEPKTRYAVHLDSFEYWHRGWHPFGFGPMLDGRAEPITRYEAFAEIKLYKGAPPPTVPNAYDAREVMARLGPQIVRPQPG